MATGATSSSSRSGFAPPPDAANLIHESAVGDLIEIRRCEGTILLTVTRVLLNHLHHAHHGCLHEIVALIGKPAGAEPGDGSYQVLPQFRVVDPWSPVETSRPCGLRRDSEGAV